MWSASKSSSHELSSINHFEIGAIHVQPTSCATSAKHPTPPKYIPGPVPCNKPGQDCETSPSIVAITAAEPPKIACPTLYLRDHAYVLQRSAHEKFAVTTAIYIAVRCEPGGSFYFTATTLRMQETVPDPYARVACLGREGGDEPGG